MSIIIIVFVSILAFFIGKIVFDKIFNPISLYVTIWGSMIVLFELKLIYFYPLTNFTWMVLGASFLSFLFGSLTVYSARGTFQKEKKQQNTYLLDNYLFENNAKRLGRFILIFSILGLIGAVQHWMVLINEFGSITGVLLSSYKIYLMRHSGELKGIWPYIWLFSYFAAFLAGIYVAFRGKFSLIAVLPLIGIILKEIARFSRHGILIGLFEFSISFVLFRFYLVNNNLTTKKESRKLFFGTVFVLTLMIISAGVVKLFRNSDEDYSGASRELSSYTGNAFISPQIYFYAASQVGVLNRFLDKDEENMPFASSTLFVPYNLLSHVGIGERLDSQHRGYFTPEWSNTATYLRDLYNDYGIIGIVLGPYIIGMLIAFFWFKFYQYGKLQDFVFLAHLFIIIAMSFFIFVTRMNALVYGLIFQYLFFQYFSKRNNTHLVN